MRMKLKYPSKQIKVVLTARQKRQIQRLLGCYFEATIIKDGLLLRSTKQKYRLSDLLAKYVDELISGEVKEWTNMQPVGKEIL